MQSYDYSRRVGVDKWDWNRFGELSRKLAEMLAAHNIDVVVGIARAGLFPSTAVACALRRELYPVRLTRRFNDRVTHDRPVWKVDLSVDLKGKVVAVVDEIADTGETLALAASRARECGAAKVVTGALVAHSWANPMPDHVALVSDELIIFPWDGEVYDSGSWVVHPELVEALKLQGLDQQGPDRADA